VIIFFLPQAEKEWKFERENAKIKVDQ